MDRPITTLFMLTSVDGKINLGSTDNLDFDKDLPNIPGVGVGLHQYYEIEKTTNLWSLNTGRTQAKIGINEKPIPDKTKVSFALFDNSHLTKHGVEYMCALSKNFVLITSNVNHPAFNVNEDNLHIIYQYRPSIEQAIHKLKTDYGCDKLTIQSGGTLNGALLRAKLIDYIDIVMAPILIGGKDTPTIIDGYSLSNFNELTDVGILHLLKCEKLENCYVRLKYEVVYQ